MMDFSSTFAIRTLCNFSPGLFDRTLNLDVSEVNIVVIDFKNHIQKNYSIYDAGQITSDFDMSRKFIVYGATFTSQIRGYGDIWALEGVEAVPDVYYLYIDYSAYSGITVTIPHLEHMTPYVYYVGKAVGELLANNGFKPENIHLVGHSLGGHIIGYIAQTYIAETGNKVRRLTALDPSKPCFIDAREEDKTIKSGVADYVEVLHCTNKDIGTDTINGDTDYFFNWVSSTPVQPGCYDGIYYPGLGNISAEYCSHNLCVLYWANTVRNKDLYEVCGSRDVYCSGECECPQICGYHRPCRDGNVYINTQTQTCIKMY